MKKIKIICPQCLGKGEVPMPDGLADILNIVNQHARGISCGVRTSEVYAICKDRKWIKISAINNRLVTLETLGLVYREKRCKEFLWYPKL